MTVRYPISKLIKKASLEYKAWWWWVRSQYWTKYNGNSFVSQLENFYFDTEMATRNGHTSLGHNRIYMAVRNSYFFVLAVFFLLAYIASQQESTTGEISYRFSCRYEIADISQCLSKDACKKNGAQPFPAAAAEVSHDMAQATGHKIKWKVN